VIVLTASRLTWWQLPEQLASVPYGAWLPLQLTLVRTLMEAREAAGITAPVVALPYPDAVGPILAGVGLAPELGAGNVLEIAAKLQTLAAEQNGTSRDKVRVRLIAHHATERTAFKAFEVLAGAGPLTPPPFLAKISVDGEPLGDEIVQNYSTAHTLSLRVEPRTGSLPLLPPAPSEHCARTSRSRSTPLRQAAAPGVTQSPSHAPA